MLPIAKDQFPKCLYLDLNKWIDLAKAHYDRDDGKRFQDALRSVRPAILAKTLYVPYSVVNVLEGIAPNDPARRERLVRFMVDLSNNLSILPEHTVSPVEIKNLLRKTYSRGQETPIRPWLLARGCYHAFGKSPRITGLPENEIPTVLKHAESPEFTVQLLIQQEENDRLLANNTRLWEDASVERFEKSRQFGAQLGLSPEKRRAVEVISLINREDGPLKEIQRQALEMGIPANEFFSPFMKDKDALINFVHSLPTFDVLGTLSLARDRDLVRSIARNDLRDLLQLSVALPYANILVIEKYWGNQITATGLDKKYGTTVICDASFLPDVLVSSGCVNN